jgi:hypothetical protein
VLVLDVIMRIARDADPVKAGFQATPLYLLLCLALPVLMGIIAGLISSGVMRVCRRTGYLDKGGGGSSA